MRHTQGSAAVRFLLILGTFVALALVAWMVSLGRAITTQREPVVPVVAPQAPPSPTPGDEPTKKAIELHQIPQEDSVLRVGGEVSKPERLTGMDPKYTEAARRARIQGVVILEAIIDREGRVGSTRVLKGLPMGLDQEAIDAVNQWTFKPATRGGEPVAVYFTLIVEFKQR